MLFLVVMSDMKEEVHGIKELYGKILDPESEQSHSGKVTLGVSLQTLRIHIYGDVLIYNVLIKEGLSRPLPSTEWVSSIN